MRKYFVCLIAVLLSISSANAQYVMKVTMKNGDVSEFNVSEIEDVTWQDKNAISDITGGEHNGHEYVDLGLSVMWATCNVGASTPEEYGSHYAWGETKPYGESDTSNSTNYNYAGTYTKTYYNWKTYKWCNGSSSNLTKYCTDSDLGALDNKTILEPSDDVAQVEWGGRWRMPTDKEWKELLEECTWAMCTTQDGKIGYKVTSKTNGNSIILLAAGYHNYDSLYNDGKVGYYWSSSLNTGSPSYAYYVSFNSSVDGKSDFCDRYHGQSVRPVCQ